MAKKALILSDDSPTGSENKLGRVLDFFGVPWETVNVSELLDVGLGHECVVFGSAPTVAVALQQTPPGNDSLVRRAMFYVYPSEDRGASEHALQFLCGEANLSLEEAPIGNLPLTVSSEEADVAGPMAGLTISSQLKTEDAVVVNRGGLKFATIISAGGAPVFIRFHESAGRSVFFCASSHMVDIDQAVGPGFYDVKDHFCSVVPLVMFLRVQFADIAWRSQELGACLIVDDPLLRQRYGSCDFGKLRDLMLRHEFTTNISFIPWNWRRTSPAASEFFRKESEHYSVSVHGCDHIGAEFGATSPEVIHNKANLAWSRMQSHEVRTGIHHDPVMIFPQGVFSSVCPEVLKRNGFLAAVNTETVPVDSPGARTRIRDVWDIAIMIYGGFPIFTRRYAFHGLENFAFDLLLGKPCLIVSHHDSFKDDCAELIELIERLRSLNCRLRWRPLGEVIRRACRRRMIAKGFEEVEMYGNELLIDNPSDQAIDVRICKRENQTGLVNEILSDGKPLMWTSEADHFAFDERIPLRSERRFRVVYREQAGAAKVDRSFRFELSVATRRILSEFRDDYLSRSRFLSTTAASLKNVLTKAS
jgi:hypothetical protein